jgi:TonB family protein
VTPPPKTKPAATPKPQRLKLEPPKTTKHDVPSKQSEERFVPVKNGVENPAGDLASGNGDGPKTGSGGAGVAAAGPPKPACAEPNLDARTVRKVSPDYPEAAQAIGAVGTVEIKVSLSATGAVEDASVYHTSGFKVLDAAGLLAAKQSTYTPEIKDCQPVAGSYIFVAEFAAN